MKDNKRLDIMGLADERFIEEADPSTVRSVSKKPKFKWSTLLASAACLLLVLNIVIFAPILLRDEPLVPSGDTSETVDTTLNQIQNPSENDGADTDTDTGKAPGSTVLVGNDALIDALDKYYNGSSGNGLDKTEAEQDKSEQNSTLEDALEDLKDNISDSLGKTDVNDNQVTGISESDIIKVSKSHIFYLHKTRLYIYSINKNKSELLAMLPLSKYVEDMDELVNSLSTSGELLDKIEKLDDTICKWEMFLSSDYKTLTIIAFNNNYNSNSTGIFTFNVENAPTIELEDFKIISGKYVTSRMVNGELLLFTSYKVNRRFNKANPVSYMPFYIQNGKESLAENVYFPNAVSSPSYLMVTRLDALGLTVKESAAYLSYGDNVYVSENNIYITRTTQLSHSGKEIIVEKDIYLDGSDRWEKAPHRTDIAVIGYTDELFTNKGVVSIDGYLKDQYSFDEYNGILRTVSTTVVDKSNDFYTWYETSASLYCIDLDKMKVVASVESFAPEGEIVRSVRYEENYAYVCTSYQVVLVDPVFIFDLSDLNNITYTQTGEIDGYSSSLIDLGNGYVLGIGVGSSASTLKLEVFVESGDKVVSIDSYEITNVAFSTDYKSYYINRDLRVIGLGFYERATSSYKYLLLYFNGNELVEVVNNVISAESTDSIRGFYRDSYYYVVSSKGIYTFDVGRLENLYFNEYRDPTSPAWPPVE